MIEDQQLKKQELDVEAVLQREVVLPKQANEDEQSIFRQRYEQIMGERLNVTVDPNDFQADLMSYIPNQFQPNMKISIIQHTLNYEVLKISVRYGYFQCLFDILNVSINSPSEQLSVEESGSYGRVFRAKFKKNIIAIKSVRLTQDNFQSVFVEAVKEYFVLKVASLLKAAPFVKDIYGFNLVIFKNAIEFSMEMCSLQTIKQQQTYDSALSDLTQSLKKLHHFKILHNDIKPKNIAFSPTYGSYVYLDFGLSHVVKEDLGKMSQTAFVGSIQFCSKQMRDLYISASDGWIDLYYNDANSLQNTFERIKQEFCLKAVDKKEGKYVFHQDSYKFYEVQLLSFIKCALYDSHLFTNIQIQFFKENEDFCRLHDRELKQFISTLPQTQILKHLWSIYMKETGDFQSREAYESKMSIKKQGFFQQNVSELAFSRFNTIQQINLRKDSKVRHYNARKGQTIYFLFNPKAVKLFAYDNYLKIFVEFIKINGNARNQEEKMQACNVFNELYLNEPSTIPHVLYTKVITFIWQDIINNFIQERFTILICIIETVVILQILSQQALHAAFSNIFTLQGPNFTEKCIAGFVFIKSLEFSKAKLKTKYHQSTFQRFLEELGTFMRTNYKNVGMSVGEISIFMKLCQLITVILESQDYLNLQCVQQKYKQSRSYEIFLSQFEQDIGNYIKTLSFTLHLSSFNDFWNDQVREILAIINMKSNKFSYMHFPLFQISLNFNEDCIQSSIYEAFCNEFTWLEIDHHFKLYFFYKLNTLQNNLLRRRFNYLDTISHSENQKTDLILLDEIFSLVTQKQNRQNMFCKLLCLVYEMDVISNVPSFHSMLTSFIKENQEDLDRLISGYCESTKDHHYNTLQKYIEIIGQIKLNQVKLIPKEQGRTVIQRYTQICLQAISRLKCFDCKAKCLLQLKMVEFHQLTLQEKIEESQQLLVDCLSFTMKYSQDASLIFNFIKKIITDTDLPYAKQKDFEDLVYRIMTYHNKYRLCFEKIKNYNMFVHIYLHVYTHYFEEEMFHFMTNIFSILDQIGSSQNRQFFYRSMEIVMSFISEHQEKQKKIFRRFNNNLQQEFKKKPNPYSSLYCISLLQLKIRGENDTFLLFNIARYINSVDATTRRIILSNYFYYYAYYVSNPQRKQKYLLNKHTTYSFSRFPQSFIFKEKIKANKSKGNDKLFYRLLQNSLLIFHKNIENVIEQKN